MHGASALRAADGDFIDIRTMQLYRFCRLVSAHLKQLLTAADRVHMAAFTFPDIQRCSPVTVTGNTPVLNVLQPVSETAFADTFRNPVDGIVVADQILLHCGHLNKPGFPGIIDQRCIASPAVRIIMLKFRCVKQLAFLFQIHKDQRICLLHKDACIGSLCRHISLSVHKLNKGKIVITAHTAVVLTKCRCDMNDTGTVAHGNIVVTGHKMRFLSLLRCCFSGADKQRLVFLVFQIGSLIFLQNLIGRRFLRTQLSENLVQKCFRHIIGIAVRSLYLAVCLIRVHAECHVGRKCPRSGRPCQEISILSHHLKAYDGRTLLDRLIPLRHFLCRKRRSAARTVRHDLKAFIQKLFVPDFLQSPPLRFDIIVVICYVGIIHICPETYGRGEILPHSFVFPDAFLTLLDKRLHSVFLDLFLSVQPKLLLNLQLNRKTMCVPSGFTGNHISLHGTVSGDHIFDDTGQHVTDMGFAVCRGRSVIKSIRRTLFTAVHTFFKDMVFFPELFNFLFTIHEIQVRINFLVHVLTSL